MQKLLIKRYYRHRDHGFLLSRVVYITPAALNPGEFSLNSKQTPEIINIWGFSCRLQTGVLKYDLQHVVSEGVGLSTPVL